MCLWGGVGGVGGCGGCMPSDLPSVVDNMVHFGKVLTIHSWPDY